MADSRKLFPFLMVCVSSIWAQQLAGTQMYIESPDLSASCKQALDFNVSCPNALATLSKWNTYLDTEQVESLCVDSCHQSLVSAKTAIVQKCTANTDVIMYNDVEQPASYVVDNFLLTYELSCMKDSKTGAFCDPQFLAWSSQTKITSAQRYCSDCWLRGQMLQLSNSLRYDSGLASSFAALTSSCKASGYGFMSPTAYTPIASVTAFASSTTWRSNVPSMAISTGATPAPSSTGKSYYIVKTSDDCNSIAKAHNVSTYDLLRVNSLDLYCSNLDSAVGQTLRIPSQCDTYTWQAQDSCNSLEHRFPDVSVTQFLSWNPIFNSLCQNSLNFVGYEVCVSPPGGYLDTKNSEKSSNAAATAADIMPAPTTQLNPLSGNVDTKSIRSFSSVTATASGLPVPSNAMKGTTSACGKWYTISKGDTCATIAIANSISLSDYHSLNPELNQACSNLILGSAYCVQSGRSTTPSLSATSETT